MPGVSGAGVLGAGPPVWRFLRFLYAMEAAGGRRGVLHALLLVDCDIFAHRHDSKNIVFYLAGFVTVYGDGYISFGMSSQALREGFAGTRTRSQRSP